MPIVTPKAPSTVSVIISTYNRADRLPKAIDSLLRQTRVPDEIIVVDDGSTDNTPEVLAQYGPPVTKIRQDNQGPAAGRNTGLRAATGDLIAFLDSDDVLTTGSIEKRALLLESDPSYGVVYSNVMMTDLVGRSLGLFTEAFPGVRPSGNVFFQIAQNHLMAVHGFMFRRSCLDEVGLFDESLRSSEDYDFWVRMACHYSFLFLDEPLAHYRVHDSMMTVGQPSDRWADYQRVMQRVRAMPAFQQLSSQQKSVVYCKHGIASMLGRNGREARRLFARAIGVWPMSPRGYLLLGLSLAGHRAFSFVHGIRRRVRGDLILMK